MAKPKNTTLGDQMPTMPNGLSPYKKTPEFDQDTIPAGMTRDHKTATDTWACIVVTSGKLKYEITEIGHEAVFILEPETNGIIVAGQSHHVSAIADVSFYLEFYRKPRHTSGDSK